MTGISEGTRPATPAASKVTKATIERDLADLAETCDPKAGLFGPGSMMWSVGRESALMLGGLRSVLLQLAHPFVSESLKYASDARDVRQRFINTMRYCSALTFGDREEVIATARRVFSFHSRVEGQLSSNAGRRQAGGRFSANDIDALWWVAATLWDSSVVAYETFVRPLSETEKDAYLHDCRRWSRLFGVPDSVMPEDWQEFQSYMRDMLASDVLHVTDRAREAADHIMTSPRRRTVPLYAWIRNVTAAQLTPDLRQAFGLSYRAGGRAVQRASVGILKPLIKIMPASLRYNPMYLRALSRVSDANHGSAVSEAVVSILVSTLGGSNDARSRRRSRRLAS